MRIALVHSFYRAQNPSGENRVVESQVELLRGLGHEVLLVARHSDEARRGALAPVRAAVNVMLGSGQDPTPALLAFGPDVVHVHNIFPNYATGWLARWEGPVVATLHNYRPLCANAMLWRIGTACTLCPDGARWAGVRHACYRDSRLASIPLAVRNRGGLKADPVVARADRIIVLSRRAREIYLRYGAAPDRIRLVPNGVEDSDVPAAAAGAVAAHAPAATAAGALAARVGATAPQSADGAWVTVGRLGAEKALDWLLPRWPSGQRLDIIGSGPDEPRLRASAPPGVAFLGQLDRDEVLRRLPGYRGAVFSGTNPEGAYPLAAVEALAAGLPLIARTGGAAADMVATWGCGTQFRDRDSLALALAGPHGPEWRHTAREVFLAHFTRDRWADDLLAVYREAIAACTGPSART